MKSSHYVTRQLAAVHSGKCGCKNCTTYGISGLFDDIVSSVENVFTGDSDGTSDDGSSSDTSFDSSQMSVGVPSTSSSSSSSTVKKTTTTAKASVPAASLPSVASKIPFGMIAGMAAVAGILVLVTSKKK